VEVDIQSEETVLKKAAEILSDSLMKTSWNVPFGKSL
jgi:hypothetical protein